MADELTAGFWRIADSLRNVQQMAIEIENAPDKRKKLRTFTCQEVADLFDVEKSALLVTEAKGVEVRKHPRVSLSFAEVAKIRMALATSTADRRYCPQRDAELDEPLAIVAFANFKGGSGKTTSAVHFAQHLALSGYRVLLADLDSQGSATSLLGVDPGTDVEAANSFTGWLTAGEPRACELAQKTYWPMIDLLAGGPILQQAEFTLAERAARPNNNAVPHWSELACYLKKIEDRYDVVVLDTRPDVNNLMVNALHTATGVVIPTQATMIDMASTGQFFGFLGAYIDQMTPLIGAAAPDFAFAKVLVTRFMPADRSQASLWELMKTRFGGDLFSQPMLHSAVMGTAGVGKETLYEYEATSDRKSYDRAIAAMLSVNRLIEAEILRFWKRPIPWGPDPVRQVAEHAQ